VHIEVNIDDDTAEISARRRAMRSQCDTSDVSTSTRSRFDHQLRVAVRVPCNDSVLTHSAYLPKSIYDPGEELFGASDLDELRSQRCVGTCAAGPHPRRCGAVAHLEHHDLERGRRERHVPWPDGLVIGG